MGDGVAGMQWSPTDPKPLQYTLISVITIIRQTWEILQKPLYCLQMNLQAGTSES